MSEDKICLSLIEKLEAKKDKSQAISSAWNVAVSRCIDIVREHMGDASTRKDASWPRPQDEDDSELRCGEIRVLTRDDLRDAIISSQDENGTFKLEDVLDKLEGVTANKPVVTGDISVQERAEAIQRLKNATTRDHWPFINLLAFGPPEPVGAGQIPLPSDVEILFLRAFNDCNGKVSDKIQAGLKAIRPYLRTMEPNRMEVLKTATLDEIYAIEWDGTGDKPYIAQIRDNLNAWADKEMGIPKPVAVSLEKCAKALFDRHPPQHGADGAFMKWEEASFPRREKYFSDTKAVLDAAGVKYVD